jgi:hypothetical protein
MSKRVEMSLLVAKNNASMNAWNQPLLSLHMQMWDVKFVY